MAPIFRKFFGMKKPWSLDETVFAAVTCYQDEETVADYDRYMGTMRNVNADNQRLLDILRNAGTTGSDAVVLEIGTGTGAFACEASPYFGEVIAVDVSAPMLALAEKRRDLTRRKNVRLEKCGFLSFDASRTYDAVVSSYALHHINDVWKAEAVKRIYNALRPGGVFLLVDVVFDCEGGELDDYVPKAFPDTINSEMRQKLNGHIAKESSTLRWIMDGILTRAGFEILNFEKFDGVGHLYVCRKN